MASVALCLFHHVCYSDLGVHVDGFISNVAHSFVIGASQVSLLHNSVASHSSLFACRYIIAIFGYNFLISGNRMPLLLGGKPM